MRLLIAPGMDWNVAVSFVGNAKMYRVCIRSDEVFGILDRASEYPQQVSATSPRVPDLDGRDSECPCARKFRGFLSGNTT